MRESYWFEADNIKEKELEKLIGKSFI